MSRKLAVLAPLSLSLALVCSLAQGCASSGGGSLLSLALDGPSELDVGATVNVVVRVIGRDGSSSDVSSRASCTIAGASPPGVLEGTRFTAERPGIADVSCTYTGLRGQVSITVRGEREARIADIQGGAIGSGSMVRVVATVFAVAPEGERVDFWAQDMGGGALSGVYVRDDRDAEADGTLAPLVLNVGDHVAISGLAGERNGRTVLEARTVTHLGTGMVRADDVEASDLDAARWDGCLVRVGASEVVELVDAYSFAIESAGARILVDTLLHDPAVAVGESFTHVTGAVFPVADASGAVVLTLVPRDASDLEGRGGTVTPDVPTALRDVRDGTVADGTLVTIEGAVVIALDPRADGVTHLFAQDPDGGARSGLMLRDERAMPVPLELREGDAIRAHGEVGTRDGARVIWFDSIEVIGEGTMPEAEVLGLDALELDADAWYGGLIEVRDVEVEVPDEAYGFRVVSIDGGTSSLLIGDALVGPFDVRAGDRYDAILGVLYLGADGLELWPRDALDLVAR